MALRASFVRRIGHVEGLSNRLQLGKEKPVGANLRAPLRNILEREPARPHNLRDAIADPNEGLGILRRVAEEGAIATAPGVVRVRRYLDQLTHHSDFDANLLAHLGEPSGPCERPSQHR